MTHRPRTSGATARLQLEELGATDASVGRFLAAFAEARHSLAIAKRATDCGLAHTDLQGALQLFVGTVSLPSDVGAALHEHRALSALRDISEDELLSSAITARLLHLEASAIFVLPAASVEAACERLNFVREELAQGFDMSDVLDDLLAATIADLRLLAAGSR